MKQTSPKCCLLSAACLTLSALCLSGYVVSTKTDGTHPTWNPTRPVEISVWEGFTDNLEHVVDGSHPKRAIREALERWNRVSSLTLVLGEDTETQDFGSDGLNIVTAADTDAHRNIIGNGVGVSFIRTSRDRIIETDVLISPNHVWSTVESDDPSVLNLLDTVLSLMSFSWGLEGSNLRSSASYFLSGAFGFGFNPLSWDDVSGMNIGYPLPGLQQITGTVSGTVTMDDNPVFGAFVVAVDEYGIIVSSAITSPDGTYRIEYLPKGKYTFYVEPLDGPMTPELVGSGLYRSMPMVTNFLPAFHDNSEEPSLTVASDLTGVDFDVIQRHSTLDPALVATNTDNSGIANRS